MNKKIIIIIIVLIIVAAAVGLLLLKNSAPQVTLVKSNQEEIKKIRDGLNQIPEGAKADMNQCLAKAIGSDNLSKIESGQDVALTKEQSDGISPCFDSVMSEYTKTASQNAGTNTAPNTESGTPPTSYKPDAATCARFASAPSCDYVPANVKSMCLQCKQ
jgi:flagellar biosynthesis/type III secretory pathway M-ring protein FliF/YscJ